MSALNRLIVSQIDGLTYIGFEHHPKGLIVSASEAEALREAARQFMRETIDELFGSGGREAAGNASGMDAPPSS